MSSQQEDLIMTILDKEKMSKMSESERHALGNRVLSELSDSQIEMIPEETRNQLGIKREGFFGGCGTWTTLIISSLVGTLVAAMLGH